MDAQDFYSLDWEQASKNMRNMELRELHILIAFAHGYIEQHKKGGIS